MDTLIEFLYKKCIRNGWRTTNEGLSEAFEESLINIKDVNGYRFGTLVIDGVPRYFKYQYHQIPKVLNFTKDIEEISKYEN